MAETPVPTNFVAPSLEELAPHFPGFEMEHFIAQGGMGAVYQARQISLDRQVAIKILPKEFGIDVAFQESFASEARAMAKLNHPNLIGIYDFGQVNGMLFLIMEFVNGKSLFHSSYGRIIEPEQATEIVGAICQGLHHAHEGGILHRDVKPANILLTPNAVPKIGDFGLAKPMDAGVSEDEVIYGTPGYTAPEIIARGQVDHRADIFSTGVMLHELLTGALPDTNRTPPSSIAGTPPSLDAIVERATNPNPNLRYGNAQEMADALKEAMHTAPAATLNTPPQTVAPPTNISQKTSIIPRMVAIVGVAAIIVAVVLLALPNDDEPTNKAQTAETPQKPAPNKTTKKPQPTKTTKKRQPKPDQLTTKISKPDSKIKQPKESTMAALARLKNQLASGYRDEFPPKTFQQGSNHYLLVEEKMSWEQALTFAQDHGAHLAILPNKEKRKKVAQKLDISKPAWLAAGLSAYDKWQWMDLSPWEETKPPKRNGNQSRFLTIEKGGKLVAQIASDNHAVILQWGKNASNPCTYEMQLERTKESIQSSGLKNAVFPVGTHTYNNKQYLLIKKSMSWQDANKFARSHNAHLVVPGTPAEQTWLLKTYGHMKATTWTGGYFVGKNNPWRWITGENFVFNHWRKNHPKSSDSRKTMLMTLNTWSNSGSWKSSDGLANEVSHILLEWGTEIKPPSNTPQFDLDKWLASVNRKMNSRVKPIVTKYQRDRTDVINDYINDMKRAAKKISTQGGRKFGKKIERYIDGQLNQMAEEVKATGKIPENLPRRTPWQLEQITMEARTTLETLDAKHDAEMKKQLEFYTQGLLKKASEIAREGFTEQAHNIRKNIEDIDKNTQKFTEILGL